MFNLFKKKQPEFPSTGVILEYNGDEGYSTATTINTKSCPVKFGIFNSIFDEFHVFNNNIENDKYLEGIGNIKQLIHVFTVKELLSNNSDPNIQAFTELLVNANILTLPNRTENFVDVFNQAGFTLLVRLHELDTILNCSIDPNFMDALKARYIWDMCKHQQLTDAPYTVNDILTFITEYPWYYIIPIMRLNVLLEEVPYKLIK